jgi:hypothetical protein
MWILVCECGEHMHDERKATVVKILWATHNQTKHDGKLTEQDYWLRQEHGQNVEDYLNAVKQNIIVEA